MIGYYVEFDGKEDLIVPQNLIIMGHGVDYDIHTDPEDIRAFRLDKYLNLGFVRVADKRGVLKEVDISDKVMAKFRKLCARDIKNRDERINKAALKILDDVAFSMYDIRKNLEPNLEHNLSSYSFEDPQFGCWEGDDRDTQDYWKQENSPDSEGWKEKQG